jgi:uncharacterized membrane protein (UPF0136 family)
MRTVALYEMLFGVMTVVGGIIGFAVAASVVSLIAGLVAGIILVGAALKMQKGSRTGLYVCLVVSILLLARFAMVFFTPAGDFFPAGLMSILSFISLLLLVLLLLQPAERKRIF